jgi:SPP1 gp7 family putative phage head morphogenesis protein
MMDNLYDAFEPFVNDPTRISDGEVIAPHRLETIIRTNTTDAYNRGRIVQGRAAGKYLKGFQFSAILDDVTTEVCASLHGKVFSADDPALDDLMPPRHYNCRSIMVPVTIDEAVEEDDWITKAEIGAAQQASGKGF